MTPPTQHGVIMHKLSFAASAAVILVSASAALAETRTLDVASFTGIEITSGIDAVVSVGSAQSVVADAPGANDFNDFRYEVRNGVLHVWYDWTIMRIFDFSDRNMNLTITVPALDAVASTSGASVAARGISGDSLKVEVTSGAHAELNEAATRAYDIVVTTGANLKIDGLCERAHAEVTTGAHADAGKLLCQDVVAEATTGASLTITARGTIDGEATTGASVVVYGNPAVNHLETSTGGSFSFPN